MEIDYRSWQYSESSIFVDGDLVLSFIGNNTFCVRGEMTSRVWFLILRHVVLLRRGTPRATLLIDLSRCRIGGKLYEAVERRASLWNRSSKDRMAVLLPGPRFQPMFA